MQFFDDAVLSLHIGAGEPVEAKIAKLQDLLAGYSHANGMTYSLSFYDPATGEMRPLRDSDFDGQSVASLPSDSASRPGFYHGENSPWTAGLFLWSQCLRYQATGEKEALRLAERTFGFLDAIFCMTEAAGDPGFLAKPYDWKVSHETSPDQCIAAASGMWAYRPFASPPTRERIDRWLPALADWWRHHDYTLTYFGVCFKILESPCHLPIIPCLQHMAYQVTGDQGYLTECRRLLDLAGAWPTHFDDARAKMVTGNKPAWAWPKLAEGCEYDPSSRPCCRC